MDEKKRAYNGWTHPDFLQALESLTEIEDYIDDKPEMKPEWEKAIEIALQCVSEINNCSVEGREVYWDEPE